MRTCMYLLILALSFMACGEGENALVTAELDHSQQSQWYSFACDEHCELSLEFIAFGNGQGSGADISLHKGLMLPFGAAIVHYESATADNGVPLTVLVTGKPFEVFYVELLAPVDNATWSESLVEVRSDQPLTLNYLGMLGVATK